MHMHIFLLKRYRAVRVGVDFSGFEFRISGAGFRHSSLGFKVLGPGFGDLGL